MIKISNTTLFPKVLNSDYLWCWWDFGEPYLFQMLQLLSLSIYPNKNNFKSLTNKQVAVIQSNKKPARQTNTNDSLLSQYNSLFLKLTTAYVINGLCLANCTQFKWWLYVAIKERFQVNCKSYLIIWCMFHSKWRVKIELRIKFWTTMLTLTWTHKK